MQFIETFLQESGPVTAALLATTFTWLMTAAGASLVFFFKTPTIGATCRNFIFNLIAF